MFTNLSYSLPGNRLPNFNQYNLHQYFWTSYKLIVDPNIDLLSRVFNFRLQVTLLLEPNSGSLLNFTGSGKGFC